MGRFVLIFALFACAVHAQLVTTCTDSFVHRGHPTSATTRARVTRQREDFYVISVKNVL